MNKNDIYETEITGMTDEGDGVGRVNGMAVFVPYALEGERVRVLIVKVLRNYAVGKLLDILRPSDLRTKSECEYFYRCGGCSFQNIDYSAEPEYKRRNVENCLRRIGGIDIEVPPCVGGKEKHYRNKGQFPVSPDGIGIYARHSHRVIDMDGCIIQDKSSDAVIKTVREWMKDFSIEAYREGEGCGTVRHIYTRCGDSGVMVCIVTRTEELPHSEELVKMLRSVVPNLCGVLQNVNGAETNVVLGKSFRTLWGVPHLIDTLGEYRFKLSPLSFYQVNREQTQKLYDIAAKFADLRGDEIVWDMYCGIGTIGQYLSKGARKIFGIEIVESAVENARENAKLNKIENAEYFCGAAEALAPKLLKRGRPDTVILDPPRKGCAESLLKTVADSRAKKIVYISCKPSTLARDLKILEGMGYKTMRVQPVDMFPRTPHVETVVLLERANKAK